MRQRMAGLAIAAALALAVGTPALAQQCDDFDECTVNDMCSEDLCTGTFQPGNSCNDFDDCTINDRCVDDGLGGTCAGDPAPVGTVCAGGCGTCQMQPFVGVICMSDGSTQGNACDPGLDSPCLDGSCVVSGGFAFCFPEIRQCPDTDGDPCTDTCDPLTDQCRVDAPRCVPTCEQCNPTTGACEPVNIGVSCDDFDVCTPQSRCEEVPFGQEVRGLCMPGEGIGPTPTMPPVGGTPTATLPPTGECVGDCNASGDVVVNELIIGVNIALGNQPLSACPSFDANGNGTVEVNELVRAVNNSLNGC